MVKRAHFGHYSPEKKFIKRVVCAYCRTAKSKSGEQCDNCGANQDDAMRDRKESSDW